MKTRFIILIPIFMFLLAHSAFAATYYIDYVGGSDTNNGLSSSAPWKHSPGDTAAQNIPAATTLQAGDIVLFRGGVVYRGVITSFRSGTSGNPITYKGDGWGTQRAIFDGGQTYQPAWTKCASAAACGNNPNYNNIYYAVASGFASFDTAFYEDNGLLWYSQSPNPTDPFYYDEASEFFDVPQGSTTIVQTQNSVKDPRIFTQSDPSYWNGAYVAAWVNGNVVDIKRITSYDPSTNTVTNDILSKTP